MTEATVLWSGALKALEQHIPRPQLTTWVVSLRPMSFSGNVLVLGASNELQRSYVIKHYQSRIEEMLSQAAGGPTSVRFELDIQGQGALFAQGEADPAQPARPRPVRTSSIGDEGLLPLNPRYVFESFVVGNSNRFAHAAAQGVAEKLGKAHNPLFLYGGVGLGKTHLLHAIGNVIRANHPQKRVVYTTSEKFTNDMIKTLQKRDMSEFRRKYRNMDLLLIDDIQFLQGKEATQEEFFHTFNDLLSVQHQIVATSDTHPKDIKVEDRLRSRFQGGLVADLQAPDIETRTAILRKKAENEHLAVGEDVLAVIAEVLQSNIRELEGALNRVMAFAATTGVAPSPELAREALRDLMSVHRPAKTVERIQAVVARHFSLDPSILSERTRTDAVAYPRQVAMYLCRELLGSSYMSIGEQFGGRDHSTALHGIEKIRRMSDTDSQTAKHLFDIRRLLET